jgi:5'-nucleotidase
MTKRRIILDKDSVVYDLSTVWYAEHNKDHPDHDLRVEDVDVWNTAEVCKRNNCGADIYSYFKNPRVWTDGKIIGNSVKITTYWQKSYPELELGFLTTAANPLAAKLSWEWLDINFPHIKEKMIVNTHIKHWVTGDIMIDDAPHNLEHFTGISILYNQPWNQGDNGLLRADDWDHVDYLVRRSLKMLDQGFAHKEIENILYLEGNKK